MAGATSKSIAKSRGQVLRLTVRSAAIPITQTRTVQQAPIPIGSIQYQGTLFAREASMQTSTVVVSEAHDKAQHAGCHRHSGDFEPGR